jgi:hypothetical protein
VLTDINAYDLKMLNSLAIENIDEQQISQELEHYLDKYSNCFIRSQQIKYFKAAIQGLLSGLDRKSAEPIALHFWIKPKYGGCSNSLTAPKAGLKPQNNNNTKPNSHNSSQTLKDFYA